MSATGQPQGASDFQEYTSGSSADTTSWAAPNQADWVQVIGAGSTVIKNESGTSRTITTDATEPVVVLEGPFTAFTSTTATRVRMGRGKAPPALPPPYGVGVLSATAQQMFATDPTVRTGAFSPTAGYQHSINPSGATFAYTLPAITSANDGMAIRVVNVSTGSTATVAAPTGSDNIGNSAGSATGATAAGPTGGAVKTYVADNTRKAWTVGF